MLITTLRSFYSYCCVFRKPKPFAVWWFVGWKVTMAKRTLAPEMYLF